MIENLIRNYSFEAGLSDWDIDEGKGVGTTADDALVGRQAMVLPPGSLVSQSYPVPVWATSDLLFWFRGYGMIEVTVFYADGATSMADVGGASTEGFTPIWFPVRHTRPISKIQICIVQGKEVVVDGFLMLGWVPLRTPALYHGPYVGAATDRPVSAQPRPRERNGGDSGDTSGRFDDQTRTFMYVQMLEDRLIGIESKLSSVLKRLETAGDDDEGGTVAASHKRQERAIARKGATL